MDNFDEAKQKTEAMFSQNEFDDVEVGDPKSGIVGDDGGEAGDAPANTNVQPQAEQQNVQPPEANSGAEGMQPANNPIPPEGQVNAGGAQNNTMMQMQNEIAQLRQQNAQLQNLVNQQSQVREEAVEETVMPRFDFAQAMYADENAQKQMSEDFANSMLEFVLGKVKRDMKPVLDEYNAAQRDRETRQIISTYKNEPEFADMERLLPQMQYIMGQNPGMFNETIPLNERLVMAYAAARGANAPIGEHEYTIDELMRLYDGNSEFRDAIEQRRVAAVKNSQQVPPAAASSGAANVALNIKNKPKNMSDARNATLAMFGLK
ncbi:MAG: hypothetical protein J1G06_09250 [Oscillospiraceae bacterium]|nr:hypothetical protein [Oscillospiraceae bacterium]